MYGSCLHVLRILREPILDTDLVPVLLVLCSHDAVALDDRRVFGAHGLDVGEHLLGNPCGEGVDDGYETASAYMQRLQATLSRRRVWG